MQSCGPPGIEFETNALMFKKHIIFQILYIIAPRLSNALFSTSPSFQQAQSALIGQLAQCIVIG